MQPAIADSGAAGLAEMQRASAAGDPYRLLLLDLMMPAMDGFELAKRVRMDAEYNDCSLIMISSAARAGDAERCRQLGIARYLTKPVVESDLLQSILEAVGARVVDEVFAGPPSDQAPVKQSACTILLAEDGLVNQRVAIGLLRMKGHDVVVANDGLEAVAAWERQAFDVVLMDVQMPEMDGLDATRMIREKERNSHRHTPIIAMTASAMKGDRERCLEAGMDGYISKPVDPDQLYQSIDQYANKTGTKSIAKDLLPSDATDGEQAKIIDWQIAADRIPGGPTAVLKLARLLANESPSILQDIRGAIACEDGKRIQRGAHTLKGSADIFGARCVVTAASQLEEMGREKELAPVGEVFAHLEKEVASLIKVIEAKAN